MQVPAFLLRRLYVKGSLRNVDGGIEFDLHNTLGSGYAEAVLPLLIDSEPIAQDATRFIVDGVPTRFDDVSSDRPFTLAMDRTVTVSASGRSLDPGEHAIALGFVVTGMGEMRLEVMDTVAPDA